MVAATLATHCIAASFALAACPTSPRTTPRSEPPMTRTARIAALRESIARRALAASGTPADARILDIVRTRTVVTVVTEQPGQRLPYNVDSYRIPTLDPTDPDEDDAPMRWTLIDEHGGAGPDEVPGMLAKAVAYARDIAEDSP